MSHTTNARKNKQQNHSKVDFHRYLYNADGPRDVYSDDMPQELEAELLENSYFMRRRFRHNAQRMRNNYS
jgi:hypothetical protein